jgi:hypothetical protein
MIIDGSFSFFAVVEFLARRAWGRGEVQALSPLHSIPKLIGEARRRRLTMT